MISRLGAHSWSRSAVCSEPSGVSRRRPSVFQVLSANWRIIEPVLTRTGGSGPTRMCSCASNKMILNIYTVVSRQTFQRPTMSKSSTKDAFRGTDWNVRCRNRLNCKILRKSLNSPRKPKGVSVLGNHSASGVWQQIWRTLLNPNSVHIAKEKMTAAGVTKLSTFKVQQTVLYLMESEWCISQSGIRFKCYSLSVSTGYT